MTTLIGTDSGEGGPNRLRFALSTAHAEAMAHVGHYPPAPGETDERPSVLDPFALGMFDVSGALSLTRNDFASPQRVIDLMSSRLVTCFHTPGYDQPIDGRRYEVDGRPNLSVLEIIGLKAAELVVTGASDNLELLHGHKKWAGATASFGGVVLIVTQGNGLVRLVVIAGSGYKAKYDQLVADKARANVRFELIEMGAIDVTPVNSAKFLLGPDGTWAYPGQGAPAGGN